MGHVHEVLLVEDDADTRDALAAVLGAQGMTVVEAGDGREAVERLEGGAKPCAILLDLMMPRMTGWAFRELQRVHPQWRDIPVALLTAATNVRHELKALDADAAFEKPSIWLDQVITFIETSCRTCRPRGSMGLRVPRMPTYTARSAALRSGSMR